MENYLTKETEKMPLFLKGYKKGEKINFNKLLKSRIVYYPGAGDDVSCISPFNISTSAYVYFFVDYLQAESKITEKLNNNLIEGYKVLYDYDQAINQQILKEYKIDKKWRNQHYNQNFDDNSTVYCHVYIMEKKNSDIQGAERFVLIYLGMDGIFAYKKFFIDERANLFAFVLQDHGFGCNYDCFGEGGRLAKLAHFYGVYPKYMLADVAPRGNGLGLWKNFNKVIGAREMVVHGEKRYLCEQI